LSRSPGASVGGQAVLEGVMMRAPHGWGVAVRRPDGVIEARSNDLPRLSERSRAGRLPFVRGVLVLVESLTLGFRALSWSAQMAGEEGEEITRRQTIATMVFAVVVALALFVAVPAVAAHWLRGRLGDSGLVFVVLDGLLRLGLIVLYVFAISRSSEIQRVFQYHGAEHKTIHAYEAGDPLTIDAIQRYSPRHPRCGTSFILIVAMVAFVVFLALAPLPFGWQLAVRVLLLPVIAGLSYEVLKLGADRAWMSWANRPGIWLQGITTKEPEDAMVPVAVASLLAAMTAEEIAAVQTRGPIADEALEAARAAQASQEVVAGEAIPEETTPEETTGGPPDG
jgi:uncharacterized protein YqhQ